MIKRIDLSEYSCNIGLPLDETEIHEKFNKLKKCNCYQNKKDIEELEGNEDELVKYITDLEKIISRIIKEGKSKYIPKLIEMIDYECHVNYINSKQFKEIENGK
jgi:hypothetical protein